MTPEQRKGLTLELANRVRIALAETAETKASVRCVFYKHSTCLVLVNPKIEHKLNYWNFAALCHGLEFYLTEWIKNQPGGLALFQAARISVG